MKTKSFFGLNLRSGLGLKSDLMTVTVQTSDHSASEQHSWQKTLTCDSFDWGKGDVFQTALYNKICCSIDLLKISNEEYL